MIVQEDLYVSTDKGAHFYVRNTHRGRLRRLDAARREPVARPSYTPTTPCETSAPSSTQRRSE